MISSVAAILPTILLLANFWLGKKDSIEREKPSPFECGFDPLCSARIPFSLQFFLIAVIFLVFDIEITLILPAINTFNSHNLLPLTALLGVFILILLSGLFLEWNQGALDWYF